MSREPLADHLSHLGPNPVEARPEAVSIRPPTKRPAFERGLAALPDALTASTFAWLWVSPTSFGRGAIGTALAVMLVEFITVHATAFLMGLAYSRTATRTRRVLGILGLSSFYLVFILAFCFIFKAWWPLLVFGWLVMSKIIAVFGPEPSDAKRDRIRTAWALSVLFYILGMFLTVIAPVPALGITPDVILAAELTGTGVWVGQPYRVVAFGTLYFGALAWVKWRGVG